MMKIDNIKEEVTQDMEKPQKKEWNRNTKQNGRLFQQNRTKTESQNFKMKWKLKEKLKKY
jgi:hypothetical protein